MILELSEHFTWAEASITNHREIDNDVPSSLYPAVCKTAKGMERVRALLDNKGITVSSWYRCPELNVAVKGSKDSQHMKGEAVDFICPKYGSPAEVVKKLAEFSKLLNFDQLILEHSWVHVSFLADPAESPRLQVLSLLKSGKYAQGITNSAGEPL